ncbi:hypothetical protein FOA52_012383 [Chlamydomonas sp. UWO 241]|nr:hypothetical protein FOA52_012383 [Chlamydomonas sp. UWO 241]
MEHARLKTVSEELFRSDSIHYFDVLRISVTTHDDEWALHHNALEIYAQLINTTGKWSIMMVLIVERRPMFYARNIALPVWCIVLFAFISFQFGAAELGARLQVTLTMVLTLVAFKLSVSTAKFDAASARALIVLWIVMNVAMLVHVAVAVRSGGRKERQEDEQRFNKLGYDRAPNLLSVGAKGGLAIEELWSMHGPTACLALESTAFAHHTAYVKEDRDEDDEEIRLLQLALAIRQEEMGAEHPDTQDSLSSLASRLLQKGKVDECEQLLRRVLAARQKALGAEHPDTLSILNDLAWLLRMQPGKLDEAEQLAQRALAGYEKLPGPETPGLLATLDTLAVVLSKQGKLDEAEKLSRRALAGCEKLLGPKHTRTLEVRNNLADVLDKQGKVVEARELRQRAHT